MYWFYIIPGFFTGYYDLYIKYIIKIYCTLHIKYKD